MWLSDGLALKLAACKINEYEWNLNKIKEYLLG